jgi:hypothetical protein
MEVDEFHFQLTELQTWLLLSVGDDKMWQEGRADRSGWLETSGLMLSFR